VVLPLPEEPRVVPDDCVPEGRDGDVYDLPRNGEPPLPRGGEAEVLGEEKGAGEPAPPSFGSSCHGLLPPGPGSLRRASGPEAQRLPRGLRSPEGGPRVSPAEGLRPLPPDLAPKPHGATCATTRGSASRTAKGFKLGTKPPVARFRRPQHSP